MLAESAARRHSSRGAYLCLTALLGHGLPRLPLWIGRSPQHPLQHIVEPRSARFWASTRLHWTGRSNHEATTPGLAGTFLIGDGHVGTPLASPVPLHALPIGSGRFDVKSRLPGQAQQVGIAADQNRRAAGMRQVHNGLVARAAVDDRAAPQAGHDLTIGQVIAQQFVLLLPRPACTWGKPAPITAGPGRGRESSACSRASTCSAKVNCCAARAWRAPRW